MTIETSSPVSSGSLYEQHDSTDQRRLLNWVVAAIFFSLLLTVVWILSAPDLLIIQFPLFLACIFSLFYFGYGVFFSPPTWLAALVLAIFYFFQDTTLRQGLVSGGLMDQQSLFKGVLAGALFLFGLFNGARRCLRHPLLICFLSYGILSLASSYYSSAKALGIGTGLALLGIAFSAAWSATGNFRTLATYWKVVYYTALLVCTISIILFVSFPNMARDLADPGSYRLRGITGSANSLGPIMATGIIIGSWMIGTQSSPLMVNLHRFLCLFMFTALILTESRSSIIAFFAALAIVELLMRRSLILICISLLLASFCAFVLIVFPQSLENAIDVTVKSFSRSGTLQELTSMTGRGDIWSACWKLIVESPFFGYGMGSVRVEIPKVYWDQWGNSAATAHNVFLESMISVGMVGTSILFIASLYCFFGLTRMLLRRNFSDNSQSALVKCSLRCVLMLLVFGTAERAFAGTVAPSTVLLGLCIGTYVFFDLQRVSLTNRDALY